MSAEITRRESWPQRESNEASNEEPTVDVSPVDTEWTLVAWYHTASAGEFIDAYSAILINLSEQDYGMNEAILTWLFP